MQAFVVERQRVYWDAADSIKSVGDRDLTRVSNKFATIYIAGCLTFNGSEVPAQLDPLRTALSP